MDSSSIRRDAAVLRAAIAEIADDAHRLLDREPPDDRRQEALMLGELWDLVTAEMIRSAGRASPDRLTDMTTLLSRIRAAESMAAQLRLAHRTRTLARVGTALSEVGNANTVDALLARAPEAACGLGFDRALVSTVDTVWRLHTMCVVREPRWAEEIVAVGRQSPPVLDRTLIENDTVVGARTTLVHEVQDNPRVNRPLAEITKSSSYGIAPLLVDGEVVGLVHGDCYHQRRALTDVDRMLLSAFAEGLSQHLARVTVLEGISAIRGQLDGLHRWRAPGPAVAESVALSRDDDSVLTRREVQIVRLMAAGDSNGRIARRLCISEGTVKTHITRILRKLRAANRAEAVSIWLRGADAPHRLPRV
ncbi:LuxR C-terminal-related transcriptional regulator [Nocardia mexicana]|uniref:GAF domain-containing protein n=1 Tax=Nocardia mexicana TaxID=279262 RepID=A0A370HGU4_9NOCA|nr:LuxR C-terminal-related transcriptional regulator [Nocardia mexicana]RDI55990.1 GAF domain-containing protein [Nocardia mexicana]